MTKAERDAIREYYQDSSPTIADLLNALDAAEARAKALERAIKSHNPLYLCNICLHKCKVTEEKCPTKEYKYWQFDTARFSKEATGDS